MWRIDMGKNIRAGAHYTQILVYDFDGDGKAEVVCKTADGTIDGAGHAIGSALGSNPNADWRAQSITNGYGAGYIEAGPEYVTVFRGSDGAELATTTFLPHRDPDTPTNLDNPTPSRMKTVWGDNYGNRIDRFLGCVGYFDDTGRPSFMLSRGYYTRTYLTAWDWRDGKLTQKWQFNSRSGGSGLDGKPYNPCYEAQGNHNLSVADVDGSGKDSIIFGSMTVRWDGQGLYSTELFHGDALQVGKFIPTRPGLQVWACHEDNAAANAAAYGRPNPALGQYGHSLRDAGTGEVLYRVNGTSDTGRATAGAVDLRYKGAQGWGAGSDVIDATTLKDISGNRPPMNFMVWWDGSLQRNFLDKTTISSWNGSSAATTYSPSSDGASGGVASNNSTKATPCFSGDILGDWREEVIWRESNNTGLRIYIPTGNTTQRFSTFLHDRQYREALAYQNVAYNQPPNPSFYVGVGMDPQPVPAIVTSLAELLGPAAPVLTAIDPDTGISSTDLITNNPNLTLKGTAQPGVTVNIVRTDTGPVGSATADGTGAWSYNYTATALPEGQTSFLLTAVNAQNISGPQSIPYVVTVLTTPPAAPAILEVTSANNTFAFTGDSAPNTTVTVTDAASNTLGSALADDTGVWTLSNITGLAVGIHNFTATATDIAGNTSPASTPAFTLNTQVAAPANITLANDTGPSSADGITSDGHVVLKGTATPGDTITLTKSDGTVVGATTADSTTGAWSINCYTGSPLADGTYTYYAVASNSLGAGPAAPAIVVTVDTAAPTVVSVTRQAPMATISNSSTITFRVTFNKAMDGITAAAFQPVFSGGQTGSITNVAPVAGDPASFDVTVTLGGEGSVYLVVLAAASVTDLAGNTMNIGYIASGVTFTRSLSGDGVWNRGASGGNWRDYSNWLDGVYASGADKLADFSQIDPVDQEVDVILDAPMTVGSLLFDGANATNPASWVIAPDATAATPAALTLAVTGSTPVITVNYLGDPDATVTIASRSSAPKASYSTATPTFCSPARTPSPAPLP